MKGLACAALCAGLSVASASAETLYVIDQLIVSVTSTADDSGERITSIHSGDSVQLLERREAYARVRLASGTEGWVKASYLSPELPLQQKLAAQAAELERLKQELARVQGEAGARRVALRAGHGLHSERPAAAAQGMPPRAPAQRPWLLVAALLGLASGFALGWRMLDRRIRRKYGGLRIY